MKGAMTMGTFQRRRWDFHPGSFIASDKQRDYMGNHSASKGNSAREENNTATQEPCIGTDADELALRRLLECA
ncbi:hypothetical protein ASPCADRAFT_208647 [Aspergillus carbonarius ITEM 5010]|uniref:Uncharacterized protein n=1 Tax=Aspergillus carbonarius (strain ITEM 5010) TaxID=602072 RepID=A0A1R3RKM6_ASPC5|nr:hypothetical protein ASPCADRAFT_208647 [Aspergillus carbonarius ITEM 5010]